MAPMKFKLGETHGQKEWTKVRVGTNSNTKITSKALVVKLMDEEEH